MRRATPRPAAPKPVAAAPRRRPAPPRPAGKRPQAPRRPLPPAAREPSRGGRRVLALLAIVGGLLVLWLLYSIFQPFHGDGQGATRVTIPPGTDAGAIGTLLAKRGIVASGTFFSLNATLTGRRGGLRSGNYTLPLDISYGDALEALEKGPAPPKKAPTIQVTIPEGRARSEVVPIVKKSELDGDYLKATTSSAAVRAARRLGLPRGNRNLEGFLFPATYELLQDGNAADLVEKQLDAFADNFAQVDLSTAKRRNLTRYDVVIIASMVEREAQLDEERPLVAAVIHNRLRDGMPLGIDATIRYAENNWTRPLRVSELERPGPYNTRLNRGLPPTPIGNPGLKSLQAAAKPADEDYLFYVVKPGTCGEHAFSSTDRDFQRDLNRYNAERAKAGGKSPTKC